MSLATLTSKELSRVQKLIERKEALAEQIAEINRELEVIESGDPELSRPASTTAAAPRSAKRGPAVRKPAKQGKATRGQLKEKVAAELKSAGGQGMRVKDLASKLGRSYGNITAFFQSTGKKIKEIRKIGRGRYAWNGS